jgi:hypothetical protein
MRFVTLKSEEQLDISCLVLPIRRHAFFEQTVFQGQIGDNLLERGRFIV